MIYMLGLWSPDLLRPVPATRAKINRELRSRLSSTSCIDGTVVRPVIYTISLGILMLFVILRVETY